MAERHRQFLALLLESADAAAYALGLLVAQRGSETIEDVQDALDVQGQVPGAQSFGIRNPPYAGVESGKKLPGVLMDARRHLQFPLTVDGSTARLSGQQGLQSGLEGDQPRAVGGAETVYRRLVGVDLASEVQLGAGDANVDESLGR
ncbi:hypothetical protein [Streptomyces sp. NPDC002851]